MSKKKSIFHLCAGGEMISAGAFTEPEHGSDITRMDTTAVKNGDQWVINGRKELITNAPIADCFSILCQTDMNATPSYKGESLFIVIKARLD